MSSSSSHSADTDPSIRPNADCGLILPKRLTPCVAPIMKDLQRELKFNQTVGRNVLDKKSELKKALERHECRMKSKQLEQERLNRRTSLELRLEQRAEKLANSDNTDLVATNHNLIGRTATILEFPNKKDDALTTIPIPPPTSRFADQKVTSDEELSSKSEFFEIHAKLCHRSQPDANCEAGAQTN